MTRKFVSDGFIKGKVSDSPYFKIILTTNNTTEANSKLLTGSRIKGSHATNSIGKLYYIFSDTVSYYEFEVIQ